MKQYEPGLYRGLTFEEYLTADAVSASAMKEILKSPAHYKQMKDYPDLTSTQAQSIGTLVHLALIEPDRFESDAVVIPDLHKRTDEFFIALKKLFPEAQFTKAMKWEDKAVEVKKAYPEHVMITQEEKDEARRMAKIVKAIPEFRKIFTDSEGEVTMFWTCPATGLLMKARWDILNLTMGLGMDIKKTKDGSPVNFARDAYKYGYHIQLEHYLQGSKALDLGLKENFILAVEPVAPYAPTIYIPDSDSRRLASLMIETAKTRLMMCLDKDVWTAYVNGKGRPIIEMALPKYAFMEPAWEFDQELKGTKYDVSEPNEEVSTMMSMSYDDEDE